MNINTSRLPQVATFAPASKAPAAPSEQSATVSDTFVTSDNSFLDGLKEYTGIALAGAAGGAIGSYAPGYWSVPASAVSGIGTGVGRGYVASRNDSGLLRSLTVFNGGLFGGIGGAVGGVAANLLESATGIPRVAAGAIGGAVANVAVYALAAD